MGLLDAIHDENDDYTDYIRYEYDEKRDRILRSNISILRIWVSIMLSNNEKLKIKPRANDIYYSNCCFHNATDLPLCIDEKQKAFFCYGCGNGGTIFTLLSKYYYHLDGVSVIRVLDAFVEEDTSKLNQDEKECFNEIFKYYNSDIADYYIEISRQKTTYLENRIYNYLKKYGNTNETKKKLTRKLCCTRKHVENTYID